MQLIVAVLLLEADGPAMSEILLTARWSSVCLWDVKFFQNTLFSRRRSQQPAVMVNGLSLFFGQEDTRSCVSIFFC